jgi:hypothetical protein
MTFPGRFKEVSIRLVENEPMFVCTVRYGGLPWRSTEFPLRTSPEVAPDREEEPLPIHPARSRFGANARQGAGEQ